MLTEQLKYSIDIIRDTGYLVFDTITVDNFSFHFNSMALVGSKTIWRPDLNLSSKLVPDAFLGRAHHGCNSGFISSWFSVSVVVTRTAIFVSTHFNTVRFWVLFVSMTNALSQKIFMQPNILCQMFLEQYRNREWRYDR